MARLIPNENTWVGFSPAIADIHEPTVTEMAAAVDLTSAVITIDASSAGNQLPTPDIGSLFEKSISGTVTATFTGEFYRDDANDIAYESLPRATDGFFLISRFGTNGEPPELGDDVEVWPIRVTSRTDSPLSSNDIMRFTLQCAVIEEPDENAEVVAAD